MTQGRFTVRRTGFTLIELLVVILVIAILALIVIPRVTGASRKAKEATLKSDLQMLRSGIAQFSADCGCNPTALTDLVVTTAPGTGIDDSGASVTIPTGSFQGPYLSRQGGIGGTAIGIPINPFTPLVSGALDTTIGNHWGYTNGVVSAKYPTSGSTLDGIPYASL